MNLGPSSGGPPCALLLDGRPASFADQPGEANRWRSWLLAPGLELHQRWQDDAPPGCLRSQVELEAHADTPLISDLALCQLPCAGCVLHGHNGGANWLNDRDLPRREWLPRQWTLDQDLWIDSGVDGRGSLQFLPIWWLQGAAGGVWFGPEWNGCWRLTIRQGLLRLELPQFRFRLRPGERIALPPVLLQAYTGPITAGRAALRRTVRDHLRPGDHPLPPVVYRVLGGQVSRLGPEGLRQEAPLLAEAGFEAMIWGTGWFRALTGSTRHDNEQWARPRQRADDPDAWGNWWETIGDFQPHPERFPGGVQAWTADLARRGIAHGLWIDPRLSPDCASHPAASAAGALVPFTRFVEKDLVWSLGLIDTACAAGRTLLLDILERMVGDHGATWIWHDVNVELRQRYFDASEAPDRRGLHELAWHQGVDAVYDELRRRHPQARLLWCASGGTMVSLGSLRRADLLWISDCELLDRAADGSLASDSTRTMRSCLLEILPASLILSAFTRPREAPEGFPTVDILLSHCGGAFGVGHYLQDWAATELARLHEVVAVFKTIRPLLDGDFHRLAPLPVDRRGWDAWQFDDARTGSGVIFAFRLAEEPGSTCRLRPHGPAVSVRVLLGRATLSAAEGDGILLDLADRACLLAYGALPEPRHA
jgi:hypothetical protein